MKIHVSELTGAALDWATIKADKSWEWAHKLFPTMALDPTFSGVGTKAIRGYVYLQPRNPMRQDPMPFSPSTEWEHGGPLVDKYRVTFHYTGMDWMASAVYDNVFGTSVGETHLIALCRAIVILKLGEEVDIPDELVE